MSETQGAEHARTFTISTDLFELPNLDIYAQMVCVVLRSYSNESPTLADIAQKGRMTAKQATKALQDLVQSKVLPHKLFRDIVGDFFDDRLSWAAKGLLVFMKNNPQITFEDLLSLCSQSHEDQQSLKRSLDELRRYGYLEDFPTVRRLFAS